MKKDDGFIVVGTLLFVIFLLIKTNIGFSMIGLILLAVGLINYGVNYKKIIYFVLAPLIYLIGMLLVYLQYKPDTFTLGINLFIFLILLIVAMDLIRKRKSPSFRC